MAHAPPEAVLIRQRRGEMSMREAARRAGISEGTWRRIESDRDDIARPAETLAAMASVVGIVPADLAAAGRGDAAQALDALMHRVATESGLAEVSAETGDGWAALMSEIMRALADISSARLPAEAKAQLRREMIEGLARDAAERRRQIESVRRIAGDG